MALITTKMQQQMFDFQSAVASQGVDIHSYVVKSFTSVALLVEHGYLNSRREVQQHIDMVEATARTYIDERMYGTPTTRKGRK